MTALALVCTLLGLVAALAVLVRGRDVRLAVRVLTDFLLAAGLLQVSAGTTWTALGTAALMVGLRTLLVVGLGRPAPTR